MGNQTFKDEMLALEPNLEKAINYVLSPDFKEAMKLSAAIYGERGVADRIVEVIKDRGKFSPTPKKDPLSLLC